MKKQLLKERFIEKIIFFSLLGILLATLILWWTIFIEQAPRIIF